MLPAIIISTIMFILGIIMLFTGKLSSLIAGYNTAEAKAKFNPIKISRLFGALLCISSVFDFLMAYGFFNGNNKLAIGAILIMLLLIVINLILVNKLKYFRY